MGRGRIDHADPVTLVVDELGQLQVIDTGRFHHDQGRRLDLFLQPGLKLFEAF
ncbi:hypothetical protein D3C76_1536430 [compost metagenome]